jgi:hypothetical protein
MWLIDQIRIHFPYSEIIGIVFTHLQKVL